MVFIHIENKPKFNITTNNNRVEQTNKPNIWKKQHVINIGSP